MLDLEILFLTIVGLIGYFLLYSLYLSICDFYLKYACKHYFKYKDFKTRYVHCSRCNKQFHKWWIED